MNKAAVLHVPQSQYAYATGKHDVTIRIRCAKNDIKECSLYFGDRVDQSEEIRMAERKMELAGRDDLFDYFEADLAGTFPRLCYFFRLSDGRESLYLNERGFCNEQCRNRTEFFQLPYIRREDIISVPNHAHEMVMYQIFPDSFANGRREISCNPQEKDGSTARIGGTLKGIQENLDYLSWLGVTCIYLNPIFASSSYHKYDTRDYMHVDPCLGTDRDLKTLVSACHARNIRVILDGVFNHCGPDFFAFQDVLKNGEASQYFNWFYEMPAHPEFKTPPEYAAFAYVKEMPKLNTSDPELEDYLINVGTYWVKKADIDGWRLDVANEVNHDFWRKFREAVRDIKPDAFLIGEIWEDANVWLMGDQFDSTMNYRFTYLCRDFFAERRMKPSEFAEQIVRMNMRYPEMVSRAQMNFLDTHDVPRFLSYCHGDRRRLELAYFFLFTAMGIPSVYYGDEKYISGTTEEEYRSPMVWSCGGDFCRELSEFSNMRKKHSALTSGRYKNILADDDLGLYAFERYDETEALLVLINNSDREILTESATHLHALELGNFNIPEKLPAMQGLILSSTV